MTQTGFQEEMMQTPICLVPKRSDTILDVLRERLAQQDATQGSRLPPERSLAADLGVSRRVLREALQKLEEDGLIQRTPGRGTVIVDLAQATSKPAAAVDIRQYPSPVELMDARFALEPAIAAIAAAHATSRDIDEMRMCISQSKKANADHKEWEKWDGAMHAAIGRATHNDLLLRFFDMLTAAREQTAWGKLRKASLTPERQSLYIHQHTLIVTAIEERSPEHAAHAMRQHLTTVRRTMFDQLDEHELK